MNKCNVTIGRFQPFTEGHMKMLLAGYNENHLPTVILQIPNKKFDEKHPFSDELIHEEIDFLTNVYDGLIAGHFYIVNADIAKIATICHDNGFEPVLWLCGSDRFERYSKQADCEKYKIDNNMLMKFKCFEVERTDDDTSATKVREAIINDNFETYNKMMPTGIDNNKDFWNKFKKELNDLKEQ